MSVSNVKKGPKSHSSSGDDEWSFELEDQAVPNAVEQVKLERSQRAPRRERAIGIEDPSKIVRKSRSAMAREMGPTRKPVKADKIPANLILRGFAFLIDLSLLGAGAALTLVMGGEISEIVSSFYELLGLEIPLMVDTYTIIATALFVYFCLNVVLVVLFRATIGKLLMGLRVRGYDFVDLKFSNAIWREFLFKPLSILLLIDFVLPLFNKDRRSLHDFLAQTMVVKR